MRRIAVVLLLCFTLNFACVAFAKADLLIDGAVKAVKYVQNNHADVAWKTQSAGTSIGWVHENRGVKAVTTTARGVWWGGVIGSVVPIVGTGVGAAVGGAIGGIVAWWMY